jgi:hypothetical protein
LELIICVVWLALVCRFKRQAIVAVVEGEDVAEFAPEPAVETKQR